MTDRLRLVVMGDSYVGKSAIIRRFLFNTFDTKYTATVEDLFSHDFEIAGNALKVDVLDTAGDAQFPAMRRLSISSAHAFLLVFSVTDPTSFAAVKQRIEEIREQRKDFQDIPIVIAGNKVDLVREFEQEDVEEWVNSNMPRKRTEVIECSASENLNVSEIFKAFLRLSKINFATNCRFQEEDGSSGLRRNLSAYGRLKSPMKSPLAVVSSETAFPFPSSGTQGLQHHMRVEKRESLETPPNYSPASTNTPKSERKFLGLNLSPFGSPRITSRDCESLNFRNEDGYVKGKNSKRSRSLIRRSSKKAKQQVNNVHNPEDCNIS